MAKEDNDKFLDNKDLISEDNNGADKESNQASDTQKDQTVKSVAKSGKRSSKGQAEAEAKTEKMEAQKKRSDSKIEESEKPKQKHNPTRSRLERSGKKYKAASSKIDKTKQYSISEAVKLAIDTTTTKFDSTIELHVNLNVDPRHADQNIRDSLVLPSGTGKVVRVAVFSDDKVDNADLSGVEKISKELEKGLINFDVLVSSPANMPKLGKYARLLGPRGLMPNPKSGSVTQDINKAVNEAKAGRVEYRVDSTGIVHLRVGKVSFGADKVLKNINAVFASIKSNKPSGVKGTYVKSIYLTTSMGPSVAVNSSEL